MGSDKRVARKRGRLLASTSRDRTDGARVNSRNGNALHRDMMAYAKQVSSSRRSALAFLRRIGAISPRSSVTDR
jgi:hypothetical protein